MSSLLGEDLRTDYRPSLHKHSRVDPVFMSSLLGEDLRIAEMPHMVFVRMAPLSPREPTMVREVLSGKKPSAIRSMVGSLAKFMNNTTFSIEPFVRNHCGRNELSPC